MSREAGVVADFDSAVGLGHIATDRGETKLFHCIEIADGSRTIDVGAQVSFVSVTRFGHAEASDIQPA